MTLKISNIWNGIKRVIIWLVILGFLAFVLWIILGGLDGYRPSYTPSKDFPKQDLPMNSFLGYYNGKNIIIYPYKAADSQDYISAAWHEWAHYLYYTKFSSQDLKTWLNISRTCGLDTHAKVYRSKGVRTSEDFAYSYAYYRIGGADLCKAKEDFIKKWL